MYENSVTVIIGWYGDTDFWRPFIQRAVTSVLNQSVEVDRIIISRGHDLQSARNIGLDVDSRYIVFLDADDELGNMYIESMLEVDGDVRVPKVFKFKDNRVFDVNQFWYTPKDLITGNYIVIGAMINSDFFKKVKGFRDLELYEDWDMWLRMEEAGATFSQCTNAMYKIHVRENSRNEPDMENKVKLFHHILNEAKQRRGLI